VFKYFTKILLSIEFNKKTGVKMSAAASTGKCKTNPTFSAPSPYQGCTILAPGFCRFCGKYAGSFYSRSTKPGVLLPALMQA